MAGSVNKVILVGNLGRDPEVKSFQNGGRVVNFSIATSESWRDKTSGDRKEKTEWHNIVIDNDNLIQVAEKYLRKGSKVYVEGKLQTRKYQDRDGNERSITEVRIGRFNGELTLLDGRGDGPGGGSSGGARDFGGDDQAPAARAPTSGPPRGRPAFDDDLDDDVPF